MKFSLSDVIRYNAGWLALFSFYAKGTTWHMSLPVFRSQIEANTAGQKMLKNL